ncbi:MAG: hypothetical protein Q9173_007355, partial [Seirophora scorigena]
VAAFTITITSNSNTLIDLQPAFPPPHSPSLCISSESPQQQRARHRARRHNSHEHEPLAHVSLRVPLPVTFLQRIAHDDEDPAQQLAPRPAQRGTRLGPRGPGDLDGPLERDGHEAEAGGTEHGADDVRGGRGAGTRGPDEGEVGQRDNGDKGADEGQVALGAVDQRGGDGCGDEADEDEQGAGDARGRFREGVRGQDLREEGGDGVEEADIDGEGEEEQDVVRVAGEEAE